MMISDVRMPGLSGLETLRRVRQDFPTLPVLLVTAYADIRDAVVAMRDGALNYLAKPIDLDELLATVRQATGMAPSVTVESRRGENLAAERCRQKPADGGVVPAGRAHRAVGGARVHHRRKRHGQGSRRGHDSHLEFTRRRTCSSR